MKRSKLSIDWFDRIYRHELRLRAIALLREKYQLSLHACQGIAPEVVRERQRLYDEHLARLKMVWKQEDEECSKQGR